jgi:hypothetical protein
MCGAPQVAAARAVGKRFTLPSAPTVAIDHFVVAIKK